VHSLTDVQRQARELTEADRGILAAHLLASLPAVWADEDEGLAEALHRDAEIDANPAAAISLETMRQAVRR